MKECCCAVSRPRASSAGGPRCGWPFWCSPLSRRAGHGQLSGEPGGAGGRLVQPLDPAHPLCLHVLPAGPVRGVLRLAVAAGAHRPQLEPLPDRSGPYPGPVPCQLVLSVGILAAGPGCIGALYVLSGSWPGCPGPLPPELPEWMLMGALGASPSAGCSSC